MAGLVRDGDDAWFAVSRADFIFAETYSMNFHASSERAWQVGHLWSLAVEEQCYLVWPAVMLLCAVRGATRVAIGTVVAAPIVRTLGYYLLPEYRELLDSAFPCVADALAVGCVIALMRPALEASRAYRRVLDAPWFWVVTAIGLLSLMVTRDSFQLPVGVSVANLALAMTVHRCVLHANGPVGRFLERPALVWIGTLSYSLYLWQQPFLNRHGSAWPNVFPINVICAFGVGTVSYYAVERPILHWYARLTARRKRLSQELVPVPDRDSLAQPKRPVM